MTKLEQLWQSGELQRVAAGAASWNEVARRLGWTKNALKRQKARIRDAGRTCPDLSELTGNDFADEEPTAPGVPALDDVPLPAIPSGFKVHKVSTLVDAETGEAKLQWVKSSAQNDDRQDWIDALRDESLAPLQPHDPLPEQHVSDDDLLTCYPVGDPHIGLLAWHEDAGVNFDMNIAERNLVAAFDHLVRLAPASKDALLIYVGDNAHADSQSNTTTKGTRVDADGRTIKMARRVVRTIRRNVASVLRKHERCRIIIERGNHDELISALIALGLALLYENEPRVSVDESPEMYHWWRFGSVLIGTHHGDKAKPMDLLGVMAVDRVEDWSSTKHRRFYCGHLHHLITKEVPGVVIEYLPTLAGSDAWHRGMGYRSQRAMYMDVYHREHGHVNRHFVDIEQIQREAVA